MTNKGKISNGDFASLVSIIKPVYSINLPECMGRVGPLTATYAILGQELVKERKSSKGMLDAIKRVTRQVWYKRYKKWPRRSQRESTRSSAGEHVKPASYVGSPHHRGHLDERDDIAQEGGAATLAEQIAAYEAASNGE
jgi:hypothetical protein